jgi:hypothetical protein
MPLFGTNTYTIITLTSSQKQQFESKMPLFGTNILTIIKLTPGQKQEFESKMPLFGKNILTIIKLIPGGRHRGQAGQVHPDVRGGSEAVRHFALRISALSSVFADAFVSKPALLRLSSPAAHQPPDSGTFIFLLSEAQP